jgi:hypothetical protein
MATAMPPSPAPRLRALALSLLALTACGTSTGASPGAPIELIPTSPEILAACAPELATTYCAPADALAAMESCNARLSPTEQAACDAESACVVPYSPTRPGPCAAGPTYPSLAQCTAPVEDGCAFYRSCLDAAQPCGAEGYALGFGEPLCYLFIEHRAEFTPAGQRWLQGVRTCLQRALAPLVSSPAASCDALADEAFASHTSCYTDPDDSFCALASEDVIRLTGLLFPYLDDPRVAKQVHEVNAICAGKSP